MGIGEVRVAPTRRKKLQPEFANTKGEVYADWRNFPPRLFRCTSNNEMAAGVMPGMRAAWPKVVGLVLISLRRASVDKPWTKL